VVPWAVLSQRRIMATIWLISFCGLVLRLYRFVHAGPRTGIVGYDDGVYFGAAVRLAHGTLPYRDFVFLHPPVILELMAPLAALTPHVSTVPLVAAARILTALVSAATVPLLGLLLRHRGIVPVVIGCTVLAATADAVASSRAVLIEPYLAFFFVLALVLLFDRDEPAGPTRTFWGGVVLGVAAATKIWAFAPIVVLVVVCGRQRLRRLLLGITLGAVIPCLPFLIASPGAFVHQVIVDQLTRHAARTPLSVRLGDMLGLNGLPKVPAAIAIVTGLVLVLALYFGYRRMWRQRRASRIEIAAIGMALAVVAMFFATDVYFWHYTGFAAVFVALVVALPARAVERSRAGVAWLSAVGAALATLVFSCVRGNAMVYWTDVNVGAFDRAIPPGRCVLNDDPALGLAVNRYPSTPDCPVVVDPFGTGVALGDGREGTAARDEPGVRRVWWHAVHRADVVLVRRPTLRMIPWDVPHGLRAYVETHFRRVPADQPDQFGVYVRRKP
jgi:alpha-1,2-mannosyltransferase